MEELLQDPRSVAVLTALIFFIVILRASLRVLPEWERAVVLRLGRFQAVKGPGIIFLIPIIDTARIVDTRIVTMNVPRQEAITRDLIVTYITNVSENQRQVIQVEYLVDRNLSVVALLDHNGTFGIDFKITKRFK